MLVPSFNLYGKSDGTLGTFLGGLFNITVGLEIIISSSMKFHSTTFLEEEPTEGNQIPLNTEIRSLPERFMCIAYDTFVYVQCIELFKAKQEVVPPVHLAQRVYTKFTVEIVLLSVIEMMKNMKVNLREADIQIKMLKARCQVASDDIYTLKCEVENLKREVSSAHARLDRRKRPERWRSRSATPRKSSSPRPRSSKVNRSK